MYTCVSGNPYWCGRLSTVDLLVLTSLDEFLFLLIFNRFTKQATLMRRPTVLSLSLQLVFPGTHSITNSRHSDTQHQVPSCLVSLCWMPRCWLSWRLFFITLFTGSTRDPILLNFLGCNLVRSFCHLNKLLKSILSSMMVLIIYLNLS